MEIRSGQLDHPYVIALLQRHLRGMHETSPPDSVFALDLSALKAPEIKFWTLWEANALLGCGALKALSPWHGEIKSMRTDDRHLRKGVGAKLLTHILEVGRKRGYARLSLETGRGPAFDPAIALYLKYGFTFGGAFSDYQPSQFSQFMHIDFD